MNIFDFTDYRQYLKEELSERIERNPKYSLRSMAKNLSMGASTLSEVLSGRTNLSLKNARKIGEKLKLKSKELAYFCDLIQLDATQDPEVKEQIIERLRVLHPQKRMVSDLSLDIFKQMSDWYHSAILELPLIKGFEFNTTNISRALSISKPKAELAVARLIKLGLLQENPDGSLTRQNCDYKILSEIRSSAMRQYYNQMLTKVSTALTTQTPKERLSGYLNLPIQKEALPEVDQAIDRFFSEIKNISEKYKHPTDIYHLSLHFINLTTKEKI